MREIKFRGLSIATGKWVYGSLRLLRDELDGKMLYFIEDSSEKNSNIHPETVGQFTGLKARGVEVYEHDKITAMATEYYSNTNIMLEEGGVFQGIVRFIDGAFWLRGEDNVDILLSDLQEWYFEYEIIGNVHESPELMEVGG